MQLILAEQPAFLSWLDNLVNRIARFRLSFRRAPKENYFLIH